MTTRDDIEEKWSRLDPVFIMGMQRSGTSVMARALILTGCAGFGEGHLWFELIEPFSRFRNPTYCPRLKRKVFALGEDRNVLLEKYIALAIDKFHRDNVPRAATRWLDKSPGAYAVRVAVTLSRMFPEAQFIFMYRNGITTVNSGLYLRLDDPRLFQTMCVGWASTMSTWRHVRGLLTNRYVEVCQEEMASDPENTAARLTEFLGVPEHREAIAELFRTQRVNTSFPDKPPGDYDYEIDWNDDRKALFVETCAEEMKIWGYSIPFSVEPKRSARWRKVWRLLRSGRVGELWTRTKQYLIWRLSQ